MAERTRQARDSGGGGGRNDAGRDDYRPKKTAMLLAQRLVSEIADRELEAGSPLPSERSMLEEYNVARGSLREALRFLEIHGVISIKTGPGGGPVVSRPESRHLATILAMLLQLEHTPFREVLEARSLLEPILARKAAKNATEENLERMRESIERMRESLDRGSTFFAENGTFHAQIAQAAGNQVFELFNASVLWISDRTRLGADFPDDYRRRVCSEHERICEAIADRDGERAAAAMSLHVADFAAYLEHAYPVLVNAPLRWDQLG